MGLFNSVDNVSRTQWRQFVAALELDQNHPGIQGIGFAIWLKANEIESNIKKVRSEGFPEYSIKTSGNNEFLTSIIYLEPFNWRNQRAFGYDMYSEPIRRRALDLAINLGIATITNKITLLQETEYDKQNGILMYLPVYRLGDNLDSIQARRRSIRGILYSPIRMNDFIEATLGHNYDDIGVEIYETDNNPEKQILFKRQNNLLPLKDNPELKALYTKESNFDIFNGHRWQFRFVSYPNFDLSVVNHDALFFLIFGSILSFLLSFIFYSSIKSRERALLLVKERTKELKLSESSYRTLYDNSPLGIIQLDNQLRFLSVNPTFEQIVGYTESELKQKTIFEITHPDDIEKSKIAADKINKTSGQVTKLSKRYVHKNGKAIWALVSSRSVKFENLEMPLILSTIEDVTETHEKEEILQETQNRLLESELRYRKFFEKNKTPMMIINPTDGAIVDANLTAAQFYGWTIDELKKLNISDISIENEEQISTSLLHLLTENHNYFLFKHRNSSGEIRDVEVFNTPIIMGGKSFIFSIIHDVTDRRKIEEKLKSSESKLQAVLRSSEIAIAWTNKNSDLEYINPKFISLFGYTIDDVPNLNQWYLKAYPDPAYREKVIAEWNSNLARSLPTKSALEPMEVCVTCKDGSVRYKMLAGSWFGDHILANFSDFTDRKRMETELRLAASVFLNSFDGIVIADSKNIIIDISPSFTRITGYSRSEVIGKTPQILSSGKHSAQFYKEMWDSLKKYDFWSGEIWNRRKDGEIYPEILSISAVRNNDNQIQHYVGFFSDISATKNNEAKLIEARQQAEAATTAKSRFLATMSHEIRTPMNGILGMAQLLAMPKIDELDRQQYAQTIINSGNVLLTLLNDILDFSKVEAGKIEIEKIPTSPLQIIKETQLLFIEIAAKKSLPLEINWAGPVDQYYLSDPYRLRQMLSNLVSNAIKFTQRGKIIIEAREIKKPDQPIVIEFSVTDTGIGIPQDKLSKLFEPFSQVESATARKYGGTGLGLSIVASLAKLMGGQFGATSILHKGSRFWFNITTELAPKNQAYKISQIQEDQISTKQNLLIADTYKNIINVLVVDDDPINRLVIDKFLSNLGVNATITENGHQALNLILQENNFDLILMDLQMPIMDGVVTTQQIRKWEQDNNQSPHHIVAFTADAFEETKISCLNNGMDGVLIKPISLSKLQELLNHVVQQKNNAPGINKNNSLQF